LPTAGACDGWVGSLAISSSALGCSPSVEVDGHVHGPRERDDLDVQIVLGGERQQTRERRPAVSRLQIHEAAAHGEHAYD
jgi:hypothetical protein